MVAADSSDAGTDRCAEAAPAALIDRQQSPIDGPPRHPCFPGEEDRG